MRLALMVLGLWSVAVTVWADTHRIDPLLVTGNIPSGQVWASRTWRLDTNALASQGSLGRNSSQTSFTLSAVQQSYPFLYEVGWIQNGQFNGIQWQRSFNVTLGESGSPNDGGGYKAGTPDVRDDPTGISGPVGGGNTSNEDDDGDGVPNAQDAFPDDPTESADTDGDGEGNNADPFPDDATRDSSNSGGGETGGGGEELPEPSTYLNKITISNGDPVSVDIVVTGVDNDGEVFYQRVFTVAPGESQTIQVAYDRPFVLQADVLGEGQVPPTIEGGTAETRKTAPGAGPSKPQVGYDSSTTRTGVDGEATQSNLLTGIDRVRAAVAAADTANTVGLEEMSAEMVKALSDSIEFNAGERAIEADRVVTAVEGVKAAVEASDESDVVVEFPQFTSVSGPPQVGEVPTVDDIPDELSNGGEGASDDVLDGIESVKVSATELATALNGMIDGLGLGSTVGVSALSFSATLPVFGHVVLDVGAMWGDGIAVMRGFLVWLCGLYFLLAMLRVARDAVVG